MTDQSETANTSQTDRNTADISNLDGRLKSVENAQTQTARDLAQLAAHVGEVSAKQANEGELSPAELRALRQFITKYAGHELEDTEAATASQSAAQKLAAA